MSTKTKILMWLVKILNDVILKKYKYPYPHYFFVAGNEVGSYKGSCELIDKLFSYGIESNITTHGITVCLLRGQKPVLRQFLIEVQNFNLRDTKYQQKVRI